MTIARQLAPRGLALLVTMTAVIGCGTSDPDAIPAVPAGGTVTYLGKPIEKGYIQLVPGKGRPASGGIVNGKFSLTTYEDADGAVPGQHQVGVTATKQVPSKTGGEPEDVYVIPKEYAIPSNSGVTVDIPAEGKQDLQIELRPK
jgi:hypothetical protein